MSRQARNDGRGDKMTPLNYNRYLHRPKKHGVELMSSTSRRLTTRLTDHVQSKLQTAADMVGSTLNQFVVQAALERAEKVIESESTLVLSRKASLQLLEMIENPPPRNQKFLEAQAWYYKVRSSDSSTTK